MSKMTELASGAITAVDTGTIELVAADETPDSSLGRKNSFCQSDPKCAMTGPTQR